MEQDLPHVTMSRIAERFRRLYGREAAADCMRRLELMVRMYEDRVRPEACPLPGNGHWDASTNVLITYGDSVRQEGVAPLETLGRFLHEHLNGAIDVVHLLPFFPWSSDDGFSVIDYREVDPRLGTWRDIRSIGSGFRLMFDLVLNHCSRRSEWFADYVQGVAPARHFFIEASPETDLSQVTRPRQSPLLSPVITRAGERHVWTTFSSDQVDLDFSNPDVLIEFLDIMLFYVSMGAAVLRLDAVAYLWKKIGTSCIHLPQTHQVVKLLRDALGLVAPGSLILTETNVPHEENVSYFGDGDEAHVVYNFTLPPLLLDALRRGSAAHLTAWVQGLEEPPAGCTFLNFTASHDGVGVRPLEGVLPHERIVALCDDVRELGGHVSEKANSDGSTSPYEMNITYFDALRVDGEDEGRHIERFCTSQAIAMALRGIPALYIHSLLATPNDHEGVNRLGYPRAINRHKWDEQALSALLEDPTTTHARVLERCALLLKTRRAQPAFHPDAAQEAVALDERLFAVRRTAADDEQTVLAVSNLSQETVAAELGDVLPKTKTAVKDLITQRLLPMESKRLTLEPAQTFWLELQTKR